MAISQLHGYHLGFELSNARLASIIDDFIPNPISFNITTGIDAQASKIPGRPSTVTIGTNNNITIVAVRQIQILTFQFNLRITIQAHVSVSGGVISLTYPSNPVIVADTAADTTTLTALAGLATVALGHPVSVSDLLTMGSTSLLTTLQNSFALPTLPIGTPFNSGPCAVSLSRVDVHTIANSIFVLLQFSGAGIPTIALNANAFTTSLRGGRDSVMLVGNEALLAISACFIGQDPGSPLVGTTWVTSGNSTHMNGHKVVNVDGHDVDVSGLSISVVGNQLQIAGSASNSGTGYNAHGTFSAPLGFSCHADGKIFPIFDPNTVQTDIHIDFDWWVYLLGFLAAAIAGIILGPLVAIILSIVVALLEPIASMIGNAIVQNALSGLQQQLNNSVSQGYQMAPPALLQVLGELRCEQIILDDLAMQGFMNPHSKPNVSLAEVDSIVDKVETGSGGGTYFDQYVDYNTSTQAVFTASSYNFKAPVTYAWYLNNTHVTGNGSISLSGKTVHYAVSNNKCTITTNMGDTVTGVIRVKATGQDGFAKFDSELIDISGTWRDYPGQDALNKIRDKVSHMAVVQGWPRIPLPDPAPYWDMAIDTLGDFQAAAIATAGISQKQIGGLGAAGFGAANF